MCMKIYALFFQLVGLDGAIDEGGDIEGDESVVRVFNLDWW